jgi:hypothetical protein
VTGILNEIPLLMLLFGNLGDVILDLFGHIIFHEDHYKIIGDTQIKNVALCVFKLESTGTFECPHHLVKLKICSPQRDGIPSKREKMPLRIKVVFSFENCRLV